jgi:hypothetical protein
LLLRGLRLALRESELLLDRRDCPCRLVLRSSRPCDALSLVASRLRLRCRPALLLLLLPLCFIRFRSPQRQQRQRRVHGQADMPGTREAGEPEAEQEQAWVGESDVRQQLRAVVLG